MTEHYNPIVTALAGMPKPIVAAVNGMAAGAGAGLAFACDFRIASASAGFLLAFANVGLTLDSGVSWTLPRIIGSARATALALLAEPISAEAALEMGLVNAVAEPDHVLPAAQELAAPAGGRADRWPTRRSRSPSRSPRARPWSRRWPRRPSCRNACGATEDHRDVHGSVRRQAEAGLPRPLTASPRR